MCKITFRCWDRLYGGPLENKLIDVHQDRLKLPGDRNAHVLHLIFDLHFTEHDGKTRNTLNRETKMDDSTR